MLTEIHSGVRGRVRYRVKGLYRSAVLKFKLEMLPAQSEEVIRVSASTLTGNVLILFNPDCNPRVIASMVEKAAVGHFRDLQAGSGEEREASAVERRRARLSVVPAPDRLPSPAAAAEAGARQKASPWHIMESKIVLASLDSSADIGLSADAADKSRNRYGLNIVPQAPSRSSLNILLDQFASLPVALLGAAAGLSLITGGVVDAAVIAAVVGINAVIGYATETEAEKTINSLKQLIRPYARIIRDGSTKEIPAEEVLVGDILVLKPGTYVTADARLAEADHLTVDESALTGESMPVAKTCLPLAKADIPLADRINMVYAGTLITGGQGLAVVVAIGRSSEIGKVQSLVAEAETPETPIERQLSTIGDQLVLISGAICGVVFGIGVFRGHAVVHVLKSAISLAVAAVPEGLPAVATTTLALGIKNMRQRKVLIRNLDAVCTLGSVQTICFDKTGTITYNKMSVLRIYSEMERIEVRDGCFLSGREPLDPIECDGLLRLIHVCVLCNETRIDGSDGEYVLNGSPTENALIHMALAAGVDVRSVRERYPLLDVSYRSDNRVFMSTIHESRNPGRLVALKGSPADVLARCKQHVKAGEVAPLTEQDRDRIEAENDSMAGDALRVLGVAYATGNCDAVGQEDCLTWLGLVGMADPIREGVKESIKIFHEAGLETVMITGDQGPTAYAVGKELGLNNGRQLEILDATGLAGEDPSVLKALSRQVHVFSRVSPSNKLQIVQALQSSGKVVAMTGDGINDGPALRAADVGVAMGRGGTDVAREIADVVLEEDDLETLIVAISDGRTVYRNIRKTLRYLLATNFSEIQVMFVSAAFGLGYPLNAMQLLWINLVSDIFPGLALALEPAEPDVMKQPPRDPLEPIVKTDDFKRITFEAATMTTASLAAYGYGIMKYGMGPAAGTMAFQSLTTSQILYAVSCRSEKRSIFGAEKSAPNKYLTAAVVGSLGLQVAAQFIPGLRALLGITSLSLTDGLVIGAASVMPLVINEATKKGESHSQ